MQLLLSVTIVGANNQKIVRHSCVFFLFFPPPPRLKLVTPPRNFGDTPKSIRQPIIQPASRNRTSITEMPTPALVLSAQQRAMEQLARPLAYCSKYSDTHPLVESRNQVLRRACKPPGLPLIIPPFKHSSKVTYLISPVISSLAS